mmetsp:Transcript_40097/g.106281  ORF Transcript_40097/g.106281 Transcript_40097/m.106281 type:complete len:297 (-) Transcript_40097:32-922(-)
MAFLAILNSARSPTSSNLATSVQTGDVCGSPRAITTPPSSACCGYSAAPAATGSRFSGFTSSSFPEAVSLVAHRPLASSKDTSVASTPLSSGLAFRPTTRTCPLGSSALGAEPPTSILRKARCRLELLPSRHSAEGAQACDPGVSVFTFTTSPSPSVGLTTSFFGFTFLGGSSFLIMTGGRSTGRELCVISSSGTPPSLGSATRVAPSGTLFGSEDSGLMSSSSLPSHVSLISFGGTRRLYLRFSFRCPGVELGSTGTLTSPVGRTTFSCMATTAVPREGELAKGEQRRKGCPPLA